MSFVGKNPKFTSVTFEGFADFATADATTKREGRLVYVQDTNVFYGDDGAALTAISYDPDDDTTGMDGIDTLANLTALGRSEGKIYYATDTDTAYIDDGTSLLALSKDPDEDTQGVDAVDTYANLLALGRVEGKIYYANDTDKLYTDDGATLVEVGPGGGGLDIYSREDFSVTPAFTDTGKDADFDNGGVFAGTLAIESAAPLSGLNSLKYTQAAGSQDDWFKSPAISLDLKQRGNTTGVTFYFTYDGADDDIDFIIYDNTNSAVLSSSTDQLKSKSNSTRYATAVSIPASCTSISYGAHVKTLNNGAILIMDDVEFSTDPFVYKDLTDITEWENFTPTGNFTNTTFSGKKRRVGDSMELQILAEMSSTPGTAIFTIDIPDGLTIDTAKLNGTLTQVNLGYAHLRDDSILANRTGAKVDYQSNTELTLIAEGGGQVDNNLPFSFNTGDKIDFIATVPILEWSASSEHIVTPMSVPKEYSEADGDFTLSGDALNSNNTRIVPYKTGDGKWRAKINMEIELTTPAGSADVTISGITFDGNQALAFTNGQAGVEGAQAINASGDIDFRGTATTVSFMKVSGDVALTGKPTWADDVSAQFLAVIPAPLQVRFSATRTTTNQPITDGVEETVDWNQVDEDTHSAYNTTTDAYTFPRTGVFSVSFGIQLNNSAATYGDVSARFNGSPTRYNDRRSETTGNKPKVSFSRKFTKGDTIDIRALTTGADSDILQGTSDFATYFEIISIDSLQED